MNGWEFVSGVIAAIAWPSVVLITGLLFKEQLKAILSAFGKLFDDRVEEASLGRDGAKVKRYRDELQRDLADAQDAFPATSEAIVPDSDASPFFQEVAALADINPAAAIASAAARLEVALRDLLAGKLPEADRLTLSRLINAGAREGLLTGSEAQAAQYLAHLRNTAVHTNVATKSEALEFATLAYRVAAGARLELGQVSVDGRDPL
ncbi:hypothetical protein [Terrabacter sp. RAF57]|uniref:hypothetical protein n=1 Tax=Terrabacter sp. RAF57 TaxID=3233063 RepID=UPI003F9D8494